MCFVASFLTQKYKPKVVASWGALLAVLGWLGASNAPNLTLMMMIICQSFVVGSGFGCMYVAGVVVVGNSFSKSMSRALGLVTCGSALGQIVVNVVAGLLLDSGWTWRNIFFYKMMGCLVCFFFYIFLIPNNTSSSARVAPTNPEANEANNATISPEEATTSAGESREPFLLEHPNLGVFFLYMFADFLAVASMPYASLPEVTPNLAKYLIATIGGGSLLGRFASGEICNLQWVKMLYKLMLTSLAIVFAAAIPAIYAKWFDFDNRINFVLCFLFGLFTGCWISATSPIMVNLLGSSNLGTAFGTLTLVRGAATYLSGIIVAQAEEIGGKATPLYISSGLFSVAAVFFTLAALKIGRRRAGV